jgi:hypothetical protein
MAVTFGGGGRKGIAVNNAGDIYTTGTIANSRPTSQMENLVTKYTTDGNLQWARRAEGTDRGSLLVKFSLAVDNSGNVYIIGALTGTTTFGPGQVGETTLTSGRSNENFVAKYTADGDLVLARRAGGNVVDHNNRDIAVDNSGNVYITGDFANTTTFGFGENRETTFTSDESSDIFVAKFNNADLVNPPVIVEARIVASSDDAEENIFAGGTVNLDSRDLELAIKNDHDRIVGMRFTGLSIPNDAIITKAYIQFQVNDATSDKDPNHSMRIIGEATDNAVTFSAVSVNISSRIQTGSEVDWAPEQWNTRGEAGVDQKTPNIAPIIQEIIDRAGWSSGNSLVIIVANGGVRSAESFDGNPAAAPLLHVEYRLESEANPNPPPAVDAGPDQTISLPNSASLDGTINNNDLPVSSEVTTTWSQASGPGTVTFADPNAIDTTASFSLAGTYALQLTVSDGNHSDFNQLMVTVINQTQNWVWAKRVRGPGFNQNGMGTDLAVDGSGNTYVTGEFRTTSVFGGGEAGETTLTSDGDSDIFVAKYTVDGDLIWAKRAGGISSDQGSSLAIDDSGNTYVTGVFQESAIFGPGETGELTLTSDGDSDLFIAKYAADGELIWAKRAGGTDSDLANSLAVDASGDAYLTGTFTGAATFGAGETGEITLTSDGDSDLYITKYATDGSLLWAKRAGGAGSDNGTGLAVDISGNVYVTGGFGNTASFEAGEDATFGIGEAGETILPNDGNSDIFIAKYTGDGSLVWVKRAGGTSGDQGKDLAVDNSGNVYITGYIGQAATFGRGEAGEIMLDHYRYRFLFVAKYSVSGNLMWANSSVSANTIFGESIAVDSSGNAYVTGHFDGSHASFGYSREASTVLYGFGASSDSPFVAKYEVNSGNYVFAKRPGRRGQGKGIAVDDSGNFSVTGYYSGSATFGQGEISEITLESDGFRNIFVAKSSPGLAVTSPVIFETRITASSDDAEENTDTGKVNRGSSDLELVNQGVINQIVGLRFNGITIPRGATISNSYIQFQTDETHSGVTRLSIEGGEHIGNVTTFTNTNQNISSRSRGTTAEVDWRPAPWTTVGEAGPHQQTPDISSIVQEIVDRSEWSSGNSLIIDINGDVGAGTRTAVSYDGDPDAAPLLHVEYQ